MLLSLSLWLQFTCNLYLNCCIWFWVQWHLHHLTPDLPQTCKQNRQCSTQLLKRSSLQTGFAAVADTCCCLLKWPRLKAWTTRSILQLLSSHGYKDSVPPAQRGITHTAASQEVVLSEFFLVGWYFLFLFLFLICILVLCCCLGKHSL